MPCTPGPTGISIPVGQVWDRHPLFAQNSIIIFQLYPAISIHISLSSTLYMTQPIRHGSHSHAAP